MYILYNKVTKDVSVYFTYSLQFQVIRSKLPTPKGLSILKSDLYWVDRNLQNVFRASKLPGQVAAPNIVKTGLETLR